MRPGRHRDVARRPAAADAQPVPLDPEGPFVRLHLAAARRADDKAADRDRRHDRGSGRRPQTNWSVELGDGDLALVRYTFTIMAGRATPDAAELDRRLDEMLRGWAPGVEAGSPTGRPNRATRLTLTYAEQFPPTFAPAIRSRTPPRTSCGSTGSPTNAGARRGSIGCRPIRTTSCGSRSTGWGR